MSCHLVKSLYGLSRPHDHECAEVNFRVLERLEDINYVCDRRAYLESFMIKLKMFSLIVPLCIDFHVLTS